MVLVELQEMSATLGEGVSFSLPCPSPGPTSWSRNSPQTRRRGRSCDLGSYREICLVAGNANSVLLFEDDFTEHASVIVPWTHSA